MMVREGGFGALVALFLGVLGAFAGLGAIATLLASRRAAYWVGFAALLLAFLAGGAGLGGMALGWSTTQRAVAGGAVDAVQRDRILQEGFKESQGAAKIGCGAALLPLVLGAIAALGAAGAKKADLPPPPGAWNPAAGPPPMPPASGGGGRFVLAAIATLLALLTTVGGAVAASGAPPPAKYAFAEEDSDAWALASARELVDTDHDRGCDDLDAALHRFLPPGAVPSWPRVFARDPDALVRDWRTTATACARGIWGHVKTTPGWSRSGSGASAYGLALSPTKTWTRDDLLDSPLLVDEALHAEILAAAPAVMASAATDPLAAPTATGAPMLGLGPVGTLGSHASSGGGTMKLGATTVSGRLPPEVIQRVVRQHMGGFRMCYEKGLVKNPALAGTVKVKFVIAADGKVSTASDAGSDLPDETVKTCIINQVKSLTFPQPEGGIVTVTYPFVFSAAK